MCLNCGYPYATADGFCSELCQQEFQESQPVEDENEEETVILAELL